MKTFTHVHRLNVQIPRSEWVQDEKGGGTRRALPPVAKVVTVAIDADGLARDLAYRAYHSKRKRATACAGRIVVTV